MSDEPTTQAAQTRHRLLTAAEMLFATRGAAAVSNRLICEEAGQGNHYAVAYHFGSREGLITALLRSHNERIDELRKHLVDELGYIAGVRDWLRCLVQPQLEYVGTAPQRTHFASMCAQLATDPEYTELIYREAAKSSSLVRILEGLYRTLPNLSEHATTVRNLMTQNVLLHTYADFEQSRNDAEILDTESWLEFSDAMVDGLLGLWLAPES